MTKSMPGIKCPNCGASGFRVNRELCLVCGVIFRDMAALMKDQLVSLLVVYQSVKRENVPTRLVSLTLEQALGGKVKNVGQDDVVRDFNALTWLEAGK